MASSESLRPKKVTSRVDLAAVSNGTVQIRQRAGDAASPYVVNLRNPHKDKFTVAPTELQQSRKTRIPLRRSALPPLPRGKSLPRPVTFSGVNLMPKGSVWGRFFKPTVATQKNLLTAAAVSTPKPQPLSEEPLAQAIHSALSAIDLESHDAVEDIFAPPQKTQPVRSANRSELPLRFSFRPIAVFVLTCVVLVVPLQAYTYYQQLQDTKGRVIGITGEGINQLLQGRDAVTNLDLFAATSRFEQARERFTAAQTEILSVNATVSEIGKLLPGYGDSMQAGSTLVVAGGKIAEIGQLLTRSGQQLFRGGDVTEYYNALIDISNTLSIAMGLLNQVAADLQTIPPTAIPESQRQLFAQALEYLPKIRAGFIELHDMSEALLSVLGHSQWQRYLLVFENNNELRGTGGFMGTFGILDIDRGQIKSLFIPAGGTYDVQGQLKPKVISPEPFHLINSRWEFQDANWWPDFPESARKMQWFYENAWAQSVDGTIVLTSTLLERLLDAIGPIPMPDYGVTVTGENFTALTQGIIKQDNAKEENRPKQFLSDLAPQLLEKLFTIDASTMPKVLSVLQDGLNQRQMLLYFNADHVQSVIDRLGWAGRIRTTDGDYLMVVHTNLAGGKTDGVIQEVISHHVDVAPDGSLEATVRLRRTHTGLADGNPFTGVQNNSYVRFYVPLGSQLLEATGFERPSEKLFEQPQPDYQRDADLERIETDRQTDAASGTDIHTESGKTVLGNWLQLKPGQTKEVVVRYRLPFTAVGQNGEWYYSLLAQKQPGSVSSTLQSTITAPALQTRNAFPAGVALQPTAGSFTATLTTDAYYGVVFRQP